MIRCTRLYIVCLAILVQMLAGLKVSSAMADNLKTGAGFEADVDALTASTAHREATLVSADKVRSGLYVFKAEYKNIGFEPLGTFAADVKTIDYKQSLSSYQWHHSATDWTPLVLYFQIDQPTYLLVRFGNWKNTRARASLSIRNVSIEPVHTFESIGDGLLELLDGSSCHVSVP